MRVAAISDIHGNLPALRAVIADLEREGIADVVVVGDTVSGPWPVETFDAVERLGAQVVRGNADRIVVERFDGYGTLAGWCADLLGDERLARVAGWTLTLKRERGAPVEERLVEYLLEPPDAKTTTEYFESIRAA